MFTKDTYPASLKIDYPKKLDRVTTFFRLIMAIPIFVILSALSGEGVIEFNAEQSSGIASSGGGIVGGLFLATLLMILFRQKYPKWWFNFNLELNRFSLRVMAYILLLTDRYPSTDEQQDVHLDIKYPNVEKDLNSLAPLIKWFLAIPHYIVLGFLGVAVLFVTVIAWFAILLTGTYPKSLFDFVVGVVRWGWRVTAYAVLLTTDKYPPFSLE